MEDTTDCCHRSRNTSHGWFLRFIPQTHREPGGCSVECPLPPCWTPRRNRPHCGTPGFA